MLAVGALLLVCFVGWEWKLAPCPMLSRNLMYNRTFLLAVTIDIFYFLAGSLRSLWWSSYVYVVSDWTVESKPSSFRPTFSRAEKLTLYQISIATPMPRLLDFAYLELRSVSCFALLTDIKGFKSPVSASVSSVWVSSSIQRPDNTFLLPLLPSFPSLSLLEAHAR